MESLVFDKTHNTVKLFYYIKRKYLFFIVVEKIITSIKRLIEPTMKWLLTIIITFL
jgi:hypothetical protein